jgi:hypothetical protein
MNGSMITAGASPPLPHPHQKPLDLDSKNLDPRGIDKFKYYGTSVAVGKDSTIVRKKSIKEEY